MDANALRAQVKEMLAGGASEEQVIAQIRQSVGGKTGLPEAPNPNKFEKTDFPIGDADGAMALEGVARQNPRGAVAGALGGLSMALPIPAGTGTMLAQTAKGAAGGGALGGLWGAIKSGGDLAETGKEALTGALIGGGVPTVSKFAAGMLDPVVGRLASTFGRSRRAGELAAEAAASAPSIEKVAEPGLANIFKQPATREAIEQMEETARRNAINHALRSR